MDSDAVLRIGREAMLLTIVLSAIPVATAMVVGLVISVFQAATQIQEQTLTFVPKIVFTFLVLAIAGGWMLQQIIAFAVPLFETISDVGR